MKKLALSLVVLFGVAMVSCDGNKKAENCDNQEVATEQTEAVAVEGDTTAVEATDAQVTEAPEAKAGEEAKADEPKADEPKADEPKADEAAK